MVNQMIRGLCMLKIELKVYGNPLDERKMLVLRVDIIFLFRHD